MTTRTAVRAGAVGAIVGLPLLAAPPAFALYEDAGHEPGESMSPLMTLLVFVGLPIALFIGISLLVALPSIIGGPRYRPGMGWRATPEWYGGPEEERDTGPAGKPEPGRRHGDAHGQEVETGVTGTAGAVGAGGSAASTATGPAGSPDAAGHGESPADSGDGGASARW